MLLAEELLLLLLDDENGKASSMVTAADAGLAGALLLDLAATGRLAEVGGKLVAAGPTPSEPALADAWRALDQPRSAKHWVSKLPGRVKPIKDTIAQGLVARGVLDARKQKRLGLFSSTRFPELDAGPEQELRRRLGRVLVDGAEPDARTATLLGLLVSLDLVKRLVEGDERKPARARAKTVAERSQIGDAVQAAIQQQVMAAVIAAATAATVVTISS